MDEAGHLLKPTGRVRADSFKAFLGERDAAPVTFQVNLFFVMEVIIKRRFGDFKLPGHVVERGLAVAFGDENPHGGRQNSFFFKVRVAAAVGKGGQMGELVSRGLGAFSAGY